MKRKDIVAKLMTEGFSEKTLAGMTDKQLVILKGKILPEQMTATVGKVLIPQTSPTAQADIAAAKTQKKTIETYEQELKGTESKKDGSEKENIIKRSNTKIRQAIKDGKSYDDYIRAIKHVNGGKLPESTEVIIKGKNNDLNEVQIWVNKLVEAKVYPFTSKNEIMELIQIKLTEQRPQENPHPADPDIDVDPGKREAPGIDPDDPFRDPHPGIDPNPKAKKKHKISAEDAKNKIIELLKSEL